VSSFMTRDGNRGFRERDLKVKVPSFFFRGNLRAKLSIDFGKESLLKLAQVTFSPRNPVSPEDR